MHCQYCENNEIILIFYKIYDINAIFMVKKVDIFSFNNLLHNFTKLVLNFTFIYNIIKYKYR